MTLTYGTVCSGIEAPSQAVHPLGWRPLWFSEIEPFPKAVLAHHYPTVPDLGDMTTIPARILAREVPAPDVFIGGTPCQSFSVAGLRKGLADPRGQLTRTFVEILDALDHVRAQDGLPPAVFLWENVPGVLSDKDNAFGNFLGALAGEDDALLPAGPKWTNGGSVHGPRRALAWRVLDAQYFGVAQRRRRVFVVGCARTNPIDPVEVLLVEPGVRRDPPTRRAPWEGASPGPRRSTSQSVYGGNRTSGALDVSPALLASATASGRQDFASEAFVAVATRVFDTPQLTHPANRSSPKPGDPYHPLAAGAHPLAFDARQSDTLIYGDKSGPLDTDGHSVGVCVTGDRTHALKAEGADGSEDGTGRGNPIVNAGMSVRRLTPTECERLQGFPDGHTLIPWKGKPAADCPDGPRYRALGNSMAVPVIAWIARKLQASITKENP